MDTDLDTLATALFVKTDDLLNSSPQLAPRHPAAGITPQLSDAELVTLAIERETLPGIFATEPELVSSRPGQTLIGDKNYFGRDFEAQLADMHTELLRPTRKGEAERAGAQLFKPLRQAIESINETFKGQLDHERHHRRTPGGVIVRVLQRLLALTAAIWHNQHTGQPITRSLTPYDH